LNTLSVSAVAKKELWTSMQLYLEH
jgi:hypothetical protein